MIMDYSVPTWFAWVASFAIAALLGAFLSLLRRDRDAGVRVARAKDGAPDTYEEVSRFLADDHVRLDGLLRRALADPVHVDRAAYAEFRAGQLEHIAMEEKILFPAAKRANDGEPLSIVAKLRRDHAAIAALLMLPPTPAIVAALETILNGHNAIEEDPGGLYGTCDEILATEADEILACLRAAPGVRVNQHADAPLVFGAARRALARAGFDLQLEAAQEHDNRESRKRDRLVPLGSPLEADGLEEEAGNQKLKGDENHVVPHHPDPHSGELP